MTAYQKYIYLYGWRQGLEIAMQLTAIGLSSETQSAIRVNQHHLMNQLEASLQTTAMIENENTAAEIRGKIAGYHHAVKMLEDL